LIRLCFYFVFVSCATTAQVIQVSRFEIPYDPINGEYKLVPMKENGLILYRRLEFPKQDSIEFIKLDNTLEEHWKETIGVTKMLKLNSSKSYGSKAFFLFEPSRHFGDFQLFSIRSDSSKGIVYTIKNIIPFSPTVFEVSERIAVIAGYYNNIPVAIHFSMVTGESKLLPGFFSDPGELNQLVINNNETIDVVINKRNAERKRGLWLIRYSPDGRKIRNTIVNPQTDRNLIYGKAVSVGNDSMVIAGVYGRNPELSRGIFVATVNAVGEYTIRYYNFAELKNFFKYMRVSRQQRIQDRIERKKVKGRKVRFNYRVAVQELIPYQDQFLLLGEAFFPVYKNSAYSTGRYVPYSYYRSYNLGRNESSDFTFDGYRYTHAVILGIAKNGRLLWDNSFEIKDVKSFTLSQFVHRIPGKNLNLIYSFDNKIFSKIIEGTTVIEGKTAEQMKGKFEGDVVVKNSTLNHQLEYWDENFIVSYGVQEIKNTRTIGIPMTRKVFFVSKITFQD
jgi:hypothetical protein